MKWQPDETETLSQLWREDLSFAEIARAMDKSRNAVAGKADRLGLLGKVSKKARSRKISRSMFACWQRRKLAP